MKNCKSPFLLTFAVSFLVLCFLAVFGFTREKPGSKREKMMLNKAKLPNAFFVRCGVGNLGHTIHYDTGIGQMGPAFEYPVFSDNHHLYAGNFWYMYKDKSGNIKGLPSGALQYIADCAGVTGIITSKVTDLDAPDWAISALDTRSDWYDKFDNDQNQMGSNIWGTVLTHAWSEDYRDDFIIWEITLTNKGYDPVYDLYIGKRMDCDVSSWEGGSSAKGFWRDDLTDFYHGTDEYLEESDRNVYIHYMYDADNPHIPGDDTGGWHNPKESSAFIGTITISSPPTKDELFAANQPSSHVWWDWRSDPSSPREIYDYLCWGHNNPLDPYRSTPPSPNDYRYLACWGPYDINPGESITIRIASGCGFAPQKYLNNQYHPQNLGIQGLAENLIWAKRLYLLNGVGPSSPPVPRLEGHSGYNTVYLEWDNFSETALDPISGIADFEGYKLWKSTDRVNWELLYQCDFINEYGRNTGVVHSYTDYAVQNGYEYYYALTAYDCGDPQLDIGPLESSKNGNLIHIVPGPSAEKKIQKNRIFVAPNPYYAQAAWNYTPSHTSPSEDRIGFFGLLEWADIYIYTLAGDYVDKIEHRNPNTGVAYWDGISRKDFSAAAGVYLYVVVDKNGNKVRGKFVFIR